MTDSALSNQETWSLLVLFAASVAVIANTFQGDGEPLVSSLAFGGVAFSITYSLIVWLKGTFMKANLKGRDMSKVKKVEIPETMGGVCAAVYLLLMVLFMPILFYSDIKSATADLDPLDLENGHIQIDTGRVLHRFPLGKLATYLSAMLSLALVVILGNYDDFFDIRWRHKVLIPGVASMPMLAVYFLTYGITHVVVPVQLVPYLGEMVDLGSLYYVYMAAIAIFCPNSINILAGINGIEVSQSIIIAVLLLINDMVSLSKIPGTAHPATDLHLFSIYLLLPFIGASLALLRHNWYPAKVFVGDTYCYFAGMVFAIVGILGHFSKTLLLLLIPQIINFIYSTPQLFRLIPCPRHRLPHFNARSGLLEPSMTEWQQPPSIGTTWFLNILARFPLLPLIKLVKDSEGHILKSSNLTILNLWLVWFGPRREDKLAIEVTAFQLALGLMGLFIRHELALLVFSQDNRA
ncbi:uncharacterized protein KY384_003278 [Bacidia gigantensis]|uniref:uncharacterized protein n=1 Tax=Bacidia gigantensis TaxID=2732470 RepID=UPI001D0463C9|nr:uncharacterized protein KY384_003278 [Bacidia gigantensis]KAG8531647.1 hypothetical protein KY384_003278 [Bacidia gigantensis]